MLHCSLAAAPLQPRNRLDVFLPRKEWRAAGPRPTVIFITGGAWTIGYKGRWCYVLGGGEGTQLVPVATTELKLEAVDCRHKRPMPRQPPVPLKQWVPLHAAHLLPAAKPGAATSFRRASAAPPCLSSTAACAPPLHIIRLPAAWGALLGRRLSQRGVLVFCLDYRNFPQASYGG